MPPAPKQKTPPLEFYVNRAREMGALHAMIIGPEKVPTATWVRLKCQYGCGGYGKRLTCPPYSPPPERTRQLLDEYRSILLVHCDRGKAARKIVTKLEREAFLAGHYKAFALGCGPCGQCRTCNLEKGCAHPRQARPAMEACGIDVFATARAAGLPIDTVVERGDAQNHYSLLLIE
ncbi:MAG: DUF2284 domain-containing protein [Candidatus Sumerlaeota bacterium]|nr:DUF2284 domain-containing protein [Candidatus Sumerlaeota bacterium]